MPICVGTTRGGPRECVEAWCARQDSNLRPSGYEPLAVAPYGATPGNILPIAPAETLDILRFQCDTVRHGATSVRRLRMLPRCCPASEQSVMAKIHLTDRFIASPKRAPAQGRTDYPDALVPGLALRVTSAGHRSFVLVARYPLKPKNPTRRALGDYGEITLDQAREKARGWLALIRKGVDPKVDEARQRAAEHAPAGQHLRRGGGRIHRAARQRAGQGRRRPARSSRPNS